ncbi:hypothetical protein [Glycomyces tenuis]|uniref:hypothetical protein n=1 Tax=Glycomyces tenuis TaxID=58116 RepID=UPI00041E0D71|nr:hypothetical protein [Glycomyces tenuis]
MPRHGRDDDEWNLLIETGLAFLVERARSADARGNVRPSSYTELNTVLVNRTGLRPFNFDHDSERRAVGDLLGEISELHRSRTDTDFMISALVYYLGENDVGPGFYKEAVRLGLLKPNPTKDTKLLFWVGQCKAIAAHYGS